MIIFPRLPHNTLKHNEKYVAIVYPGEGVVFEVGLLDADGHYLNMWVTKEWFKVKDIDFEEAGESPSTSSIKTDLESYGWYVVIDKG